MKITTVAAHRLTAAAIVALGLATLTPTGAWAGAGAGAGAVDANDDLAALSTVFDGATALEGWNAHVVEGFSPKWEAPRIEDGQLVLEPTSSGWFEDMQAGHLYREVEGNFVVTAHLRVEGTEAQLPQTLFSLAGIFIRAPRPGLSAANWEPNRENWLFFSVGTAFPAGAPQFEVKTTYNSLSTLRIHPADHVYEGGKTRQVALRVARHGELFSLLYRVEGASEFALLDQFIRPDLPEVLNVGLTAYADWGSAAPIYPDFVRYNTEAPALNGDLVARIERIEFRRPAVDRFPVASFDVRSSFMPEVSQARIDDLIKN
jgi:hypothetical protein